MMMLSKNFILEQPFEVLYCIRKEKTGYYIELQKQANGKIIESAERFMGSADEAECVKFLELLYYNDVTPVHLNSIAEDIF